MANGKKDAVIVIRADDKSAKGFKSAQKNLQNLASSAAVLQGPLGAVAGRINAFGAALGRMGPLAIVAGVGLSSLILGLKASIQSASDLEQQTFRMNAVLKATQGASGLTAQAIDEYAYSLAESTLASQQGARDAAAALTTFTSISGERFKQVISLAQDYVAIFGGDLVSATVKFGRAFDNPREGLQGLSRQFTVFDTAHRALISRMYESGDVVGAQEAIYKGLAGVLTGAGVGQAGGLAGAIDTLGERLTKLSQIVGDKSGGLSATTAFIKEVSGGLKRLELESGAGSAAEQVDFLALKISALTARMAVLKELGLDSGVDSIWRTKQYKKLGGQVRALSAEQNVYIATLRKSADADREAAAAAATVAAAKAAETLRLKKMNQSSKDFAAFKKAEGRLIDATRTPLEKIAIAQIKYNDAIATGLVNADAYKRNLDNISAAARKALASSQRVIDYSMGSTETDPARIVRDNFDIRLQALRDALRTQGYTELEAAKMVASARLALEKRSADELMAIRVQSAMKVVGSTTSILDSLASIYGTKTQLQKDKTNEQYQAMADDINAQVDAETITRAQGDAKLNALEAKRQQAQNANAKKTFETGKKLDRASAIISTAAGVTAALSDKTVPTYVRFANAAAVAVAGAAQIAAINATSFDGGGGVGAVGSSGSNISTPKLDQGAGGQGALTVQFLGDFYGWDQYMQERVIGGIRDAVDNRDVTIIGNSSRQAQELRA